MADKPRFLDVWIVETNTVYREVPFTVVVDWVQQGRLLEDDLLRWSGQADWFPLGTKPSFSAYLPRSEPQRVEDEAEVLEPVHGEITWKKRPGDEDEDVDMIPLIDVSLVLLIFFIMTATGLAASQTIVLPESESGVVLSDPNLLWIGYDRDKRTGEVVYSLGWGESAAAPEDQNITTQDKLIERLEARLQENPNLIGVNLRGGEKVPWGVDRWLEDELKVRRVPMIMLGVRSKVGQP